MTVPHFEFSQAAKLYVQYVETIEELKQSPAEKAQEHFQKHKALVSEMRAEAYLSISSFGEALLSRLSSLPWANERLELCKETQHTTRSYLGGRIHYRWLHPINSTANPSKGGWIYIICPIPEKISTIENDQKLRTMFFDVISRNRLGVSVGYDGQDMLKRDRISNLAKDPKFGSLDKVESPAWSSMWIPIDPASPVDSALGRVEGLLRAIREIESS